MQKKRAIRLDVQQSGAVCQNHSYQLLYSPALVRGGGGDVIDACWHTDRQLALSAHSP